MLQTMQPIINKLGKKKKKISQNKINTFFTPNLSF